MPECNMLFIHVLNPFGMKHNRRFNQNNVDLNRNFLTEEEFKEQLDKDPNENG